MPIYTEYDMHYRLEGLFKGAMAFGVTNLTNAKPPKDDSNNPNLNYDIYSYLGRTYYTSLSQAY
jgi:outer membrane receptor protein involved in Fe transport